MTHEWNIENAKAAAQDAANRRAVAEAVITLMGPRQLKAFRADVERLDPSSVPNGAEHKRTLLAMIDRRMQKGSART